MGNSGDLVVEELPPAMAERFDGELLDVIASLGDLSDLEQEALLFAQVA